MKTVEIRSTGVHITELGFGGGGLGEFFTHVSDTDARNTLDSMFSGGVRFFDTAPFYGLGLSEHRVGAYLRQLPRTDYVLSTKVGRVLRAPRDPSNWTNDSAWLGGLPFDLTVSFSYDAVMRSYEDSMQRMGINKVDMLVLHDISSAVYDDQTVAEQWAALNDSGWRALEELRTSGAIRAIGLGIKVLAEIPRFLDAFDLDFIYVVGSYTLLDQTAFPDTLAMCSSHRVDAVLAGAFNSGILAQGPVSGAKFNWRPATPEVLDRVKALHALCREYRVSLQALAIQFPLAHPAIKSVLVGPVTPLEAQENLDAYNSQIPAELWRELIVNQWIPEDAPIPVTDPRRVALDEAS